MTSCALDIWVHVYEYPLVPKLLSFLQTVLSLLVLLILIVGPIVFIVLMVRRGLKERSVGKLVLVPTLLLLFLLFVLSTLTGICPPSSRTIYTSEDFIEKITVAEEYEGAFVFHPGGRLDVSSSPYSFVCENCSIAVEKKLAVSDSEQQLFIYKCEGEETIHLSNLAYDPCIGK